MLRGKHLEFAVAKTLRVFDARPVGFREVELYLLSNVIETGLASEGDIDSFISQLKLDLDVAGATAKRLLREQQAKPLFEAK